MDVFHVGPGEHAKLLCCDVNEKRGERDPLGGRTRHSHIEDGKINFKDCAIWEGGWG